MDAYAVGALCQVTLEGGSVSRFVVRHKIMFNGYESLYDNLELLKMLSI